MLGNNNVLLIIRILLYNSPIYLNRCDVRYMKTFQFRFTLKFLWEAMVVDSN